MKNQYSILFLCLNILLLSIACGDGNEGLESDLCHTDFDQKAMFENIADQLILPAYEKLQQKTEALAQASDQFTQAPSENSLTILRAALSEAWLQWQSVAQYEFGPAEEVFLRSSLNNFPTNIEQISTNVAAELYNFDQPDVFDKGFPALEFLLFGVAENTTQIVDMYSKTADTNAIKFRQYLTALVTDIQTKVDATHHAWKNEYRSQFINNTGTAAGSSLSLIINALNQNYELIKREKMGVPSGVLTLGFANPDRVEALYSGQSQAYALAALEASEGLYLGKSETGVDGLGLDDYLEATNARKNDASLNEVIKDQFRQAIHALENVATPLSSTITNDQASVEQAYNEISKQLVNIKTDMPSVLCVSITYIDNPSDSD